MLTLIGKHRWWFAGVALAAVLLRLFFIWKLALVTDDAIFYGDIARNLLHGHGFGVPMASGWQPTLSRLPGYPFFLAFSFLIGGEGNYRAAMLLQLVFDLMSCFLVADVARRVFGGGAASGNAALPAAGAKAGNAALPAAGAGAARSAFLLAAFCPFLMNYVAAPLTECMEIFCIAAALDCALAALDSALDSTQEAGLLGRAPGWWTLCGISCAGATLLRPDGGLILAGIALPVAALGWRNNAWRKPQRRRELFRAIVLLGTLSLAPLLPWTIRNWRVFHVFQPLVNTHANDPGEFVPHGWERWLRSWLIDYASLEDVAFQVPGQPIDAADVPVRAYSSEAQRVQVLGLLDQYNAHCTMTPELDRQFAERAAQNIRLHPLRYYLLLPAARMVDMWLRPRTELMPLDTHFWNFAEDPHDSLCALALGALNLAYVAAAVAGAWVMRRRMKYVALLLAYPVLRSLFLATTGAAEDRYTLECFPFVLVLAAGFLSWWQARRAACELKAHSAR